MKKLAILLMVSVWCGTLFSQNMKLDVKKMYDLYTNSEGYSMDVSVTVHYNGIRAQAIEGNVMKNKNSFYRMFDGEETMMNDNYLILIDHNARVINCYNALPESDDQLDFTKYVEQGLFNSENVSFKLLSGGRKQYSFHDKDAGFKNITIVLGNDNKFLEMSYTMEQFNPEESKNDIYEIRCQYKNIKINPTFSTSDFQENKFIKVKNNEITVNNNLQGYQVNNNLN